jgi:hypothetical protein
MVMCIKQLTAIYVLWMLMLCSALVGPATASSTESSKYQMAERQPVKRVSLQQQESEQTASDESFTHHRFVEIHFCNDVASISLSYKLLGDQNNGCQYIAFKKYPSLAVMVMDGTIEHADLEIHSHTDKHDLFKQSIFQALATGQQSLAEFRQQYPEVEIYDHEYLPGVYLHWYNNDKTRAVVIEYVNGQVDRVKVGLVPSVLWVEGCA